MHTNLNDKPKMCTHFTRFGYLCWMNVLYWNTLWMKSFDFSLSATIHILKMFPRIMFHLMRGREKCLCSNWNRRDVKRKRIYRKEKNPPQIQVSFSISAQWTTLTFTKTSTIDWNLQVFGYPKSNQIISITFRTSSEYKLIRN